MWCDGVQRRSKSQSITSLSGRIGAGDIRHEKEWDVFLHFDSATCLEKTTLSSDPVPGGALTSVSSGASRNSIIPVKIDAGKKMLHCLGKMFSERRPMDVLSDLAV